MTHLWHPLKNYDSEEVAHTSQNILCVLCHVCVFKCVCVQGEGRFVLVNYVCLKENMNQNNVARICEAVCFGC